MQPTLRSSPEREIIPLGWRNRPPTVLFPNRAGVSESTRFSRAA